MGNLSTGTEPRARRPNILHTNKELRLVMTKAGFFTIRQLATAVERHETVVGEILRGEGDPAPLAEKAIADALGVSVNRLRTICAPPSAPVQQELAQAA